MRADLPRLGLGASALAGLYAPVDESSALATIDRAYESGIRLFDTAPMYGYGQSETRLGKGLATRNRDDLIVSTKVGRLLRDAPPNHDGYLWKDVPAREAYFDFSRRGVSESLESSLDRLQLEAVDLVYIHDPPDEHFGAALDGAYSALAELRSSGRVRWIGVGSNFIDVQLRFLEAADIDCLLVAGRYTILEHERALRELLPVSAARGVNVIVGGVFNSGILAAPIPGANYNYLPAPAEVIARGQQLERMCSKHGVSLKAAALQFPLAHPAVSCLLIGSRSPRELDECLELLDLGIPEALWDDLREEGLMAADCPTPVAVH